MCLPALGAVAGLAGSVVSAMGAKSQADAQANMDEYNSKVERINARSRRWEGMKEQEQIGVKYDKLEGQQIATAAKGGVDPNFGSAALLIFGETHENMTRDQDVSFLKAESAAIGHENKATAFEESAKAHRKAGKIAAAGSFLSGLSGAVSSFGKGGGGGGMMINETG